MIEVCKKREYDQLTMKKDYIKNQILKDNCQMNRPMIDFFFKFWHDFQNISI